MCERSKAWASTLIPSNTLIFFTGQDLGNGRKPRKSILFQIGHNRHFCIKAAIHKDINNSTSGWLRVNNENHRTLESAINSKLMSRTLICCSHLARLISGLLKQHLVVTLAFKGDIIYPPLLCWFLTSKHPIILAVRRTQKVYGDRE